MSDVTTKAKRRNKCWPVALKRGIVAALLAPGGSVSVIVRQYDINANQVFSWRRRYRAVEQPSPPAPVLVPVAIEIEIAGDYRFRVGASFDSRALKRVLDVLRKR